MSEQADNIILNSKKPSELTVRSSLNGTEFNVVIADGEFQKILVSSADNFIKIGDYVFRRIRGYTGSVINSEFGFYVNDFITDGIIRTSNGFNIYVNNAKYIGGTTSDFGTYDNVTRTFTGGSYIYYQYKEL